MKPPSVRTFLAITVSICFIGATIDSIALNRPIPAEIITPVMLLVVGAYMARRNGNGDDHK